MAENPRTTAARDHDDSALIDSMEDAPGVDGSAGGGVQRDVATQDELARAVDPDAHRGVAKQTTIDNDQARPADRGPDRQ